MAKVAPEARALAHRGEIVLPAIWHRLTNAGDMQERLNEIRQLYASMRPYFSGAAYVNYCDKDLADRPAAYWGKNLARLKQIKSTFDPDNVFRHAQSVPLA